MVWERTYGEVELYAREVDEVVEVCELCAGELVLVF